MVEKKTGFVSLGNRFTTRTHTFCPLLFFSEWIHLACTKMTTTTHKKKDKRMVASEKYVL